ELVQGAGALLQLTLAELEVEGVGQAVDDVPDEVDVQGLDDRGRGDAGEAHDIGVGGRDEFGGEAHLFQEGQHGRHFGAGRGGVGGVDLAGGGEPDHLGV